MKQLAILLLAFALCGFSYTGDGANGFTSGEQFTHTNANEIDAALDAIEADLASIGALETQLGVNILLNTEIDTSAELAAILTDESGTSGGFVRSVGGLIESATIRLTASTTPTPTNEGEMQWDSDDDQLCVGDGAGTVCFTVSSGTEIDSDSDGTPEVYVTTPGASGEVCITPSEHATRCIAKFDSGTDQILLDLDEDGAIDVTFDANGITTKDLSSTAGNLIQLFANEDGGTATCATAGNADRLTIVDSDTANDSYSWDVCEGTTKRGQLGRVYGTFPFYATAIADADDGDCLNNFSEGDTAPRGCWSGGTNLSDMGYLIPGTNPIAERVACMVFIGTWDAGTDEITVTVYFVQDNSSPVTHETTASYTYTEHRKYTRGTIGEGPTGGDSDPWAVGVQLDNVNTSGGTASTDDYRMRCDLEVSWDAPS